MNRFFISLLALFIASTNVTAASIAPEKDIYGNFVSPEVAKMRVRTAREDAIRDHRVLPGMTEREVIQALGTANRINNNGGRVQWVYDNGRETTYVYFENGLVR